MTIRVKNWGRFQHYRNRRPPWIRLYNDLLDDPEFEELSGELVKTLIKIWLAVSEFSVDGTLPPLKRLALCIHVDRKKLSSQINELSQWFDCDASALLAYCNQLATSETEGETEGETEQNTAHTRGSINMEFERFWQEYPKKSGKRPALRAWKNAKKRGMPPVDELVVILAHQKTWRQWLDGFIPNPATWLNGDRWADEEPATRGGVAATRTQMVLDNSMRALRED